MEMSKRNDLCVRETVDQLSASAVVGRAMGKVGRGPGTARSPSVCAGTTL